MFGLFFTDAKEVTCYQDVMNCDVERFKTVLPLNVRKTYLPSLRRLLKLALCLSLIAKKIFNVLSMRLNTPLAK